MRILSFLFLLLALGPLGAQDLATRMAAVPIDASLGRVGVGVLDMQTGTTWYHSGEEAFPMQSVFKLPLAIAVLKQVDKGELSLDQKVTITPADFAPSWSPLRDEFQGESAEYTLRDLIKSSMALSDNTAADVLLRVIGGPTAVTESLAIPGLRIDRSERELQPESVGLGKFLPEYTNRDTFQKAIDDLSPEAKKAAAATYLADPRDTSTPQAMVQLLRDLSSGNLLSQDSTDFLLQIMKETYTGANRLRAGLPGTDWALAHKTGTGYEIEGIALAANDAGIALGPNGRAAIIVVFVAGATADEATRDRLMADLTKAALAGPSL